MEATAPLLDVCPNCGNWADLLESTGWCATCTTQHSDQKICTDCGTFFPKSAEVDKCWDCRKEEWLTRNADAIEYYMALGFSFTRACIFVRNDIRPTCKNCGQPIQGGRAGKTNFCSKPKCKKASRQYRVLKNTEGLDPDVALAIAVQRNVRRLF